MTPEGEHDREREVRISRTSDGELGGAMLWLSLCDLAELGIDPDAQKIAYRAEDGELKIESGSGADG